MHCRKPWWYVQPSRKAVKHFTQHMKNMEDILNAVRALSLRSQIVTLDVLLFLKSQIVTSSEMHGGRRFLPFVFTEQGVAMLSAVLKAPSLSVSVLKSWRLLLNCENLIRRSIFYRIELPT